MSVPDLTSDIDVGLASEPGAGGFGGRAAALLGAGVGQLSWLSFYAVSFALALPVALGRALVVYALVALYMLIDTGRVTDGTAQWIALLVAFGPLAASLLALVWPFGSGHAWQAQIGGRGASPRERERIDDALAELRTVDPELRVPRHIFVVDRDGLDGALYGGALMLSSGLVHSHYLASVIAHELGHHNTIDGRLSAALYRLSFPRALLERIRPATRGCLLGVFYLASGLWVATVAMALQRPFWAAFFRAREYTADAYAVRLGQGPLLYELLEHQVLPEDRPVPLRELIDASHPPTELRLARLEQAIAAHQPQRTQPSVAGHAATATVALRLPVVTLALVTISIAGYLAGVRSGGSVLGGPASDVTVRYGAIPYEITHPGQHCALNGYPVYGPAVLCEGQPDVSKGAFVPATPTAAETLVSSVFLQGGLVALIVNMLFLALIGTTVETHTGRLGFLILYLLAATATVALQTLAAPGSATPILGAGGATAGVLGAHARLALRARTTASATAAQLAIDIPALLCSFLVCQAILLGIGATDPVGAIPTLAYLAPTAGIALGYTLMPVLARSKRPAAHRSTRPPT